MLRLLGANKQAFAVFELELHAPVPADTESPPILKRPAYAPATKVSKGVILLDLEALDILHMDEAPVKRRKVNPDAILSNFRNHAHLEKYKGKKDPKNGPDNPDHRIWGRIGTGRFSQDDLPQKEVPAHPN